MVTEAISLGPRFYCVERVMSHGFSKQVFLLAQFVPHQKIYVSPCFGVPLRVPFNFSVHTREVVLRFLSVSFL